MKDRIKEIILYIALFITIAIFFVLFWILIKFMWSAKALMVFGAIAATCYILMVAKYLK